MLLLVYTAILPTVVARQYLSRLDERTAIVRSSLKDVSSGLSVNFLADPDVSLPERQRQIIEAKEKTQAARQSLAELERSNKFAALPGNGFAGDYHTAIVRQERAANIVRQSSQVLDQYQQLLNYLAAYTRLQTNLNNHLDEVNKIRNFNSLIGKGGGMAKTAGLIRADQKTMASLTPPPDFNALHAEANITFNQAAIGFERLARGLNKGSDSQIYGAVSSLESVTLKNQVDDKNLLTKLANGSPTLRQIAELSEKVEHGQGR